MSYTALYRKFRPDIFDDVKGQEPIIKTLVNQIKYNRIGHAYLFCGTRGTGKTTVAKIFAKAVNCGKNFKEDSDEIPPCNNCDICNKITNNSSLNIIEIDAASNNGVDSIRKIVDEVRYSPTEGRYKVYIIDEVHMLSISAFNALLKTLEEPPEYVIFILATTDVHKIPITVLSRCQRFDFKRIAIDTIYSRLLELINKEKITAEEKALQYIARMADGALRDALSLLDKCISYNLGNELTYDNVLKALGTVSINIFSNLLIHIKNQDINSCIELIDKIEFEGRDLIQFVIDFIWYLRNILLIQSSDKIEDVLEVSSEDILILKEDSKLFKSEVIIRYINVFSELSNQIKYAPRKRVALEIGVIKLCRPDMETSNEALVNRILLLEEKIEKGLIVNQESVGIIEKKEGTNKEEVKNIESENIIDEIPEAILEDLKTIVRNWARLVKEIERKSPPFGFVLKNVKLSINKDNSLLLVTNDIVDFELISREDNINLIKEVVEKNLKKKVHINVKNVDLKNKEKDNFPDLSKIIKLPIDYID